MKTFTEVQVLELLEKQKILCAQALNIQSKVFIYPKDSEKISEIIVSAPSVDI